MSMPDRAPLRSPFRSPAAFASAVRGVVRRHRLLRTGALVTIGVVLLLRMFASIDAADAERSRWGPPAQAWITTTDVAAGTELTSATLRAATVPPGLLPADAVVEDPTGQRVRTDLGAGEIIVTGRITDDVSAHAARIPPGAVAVALDRTSDLFAVGDRVDLHDQIDGALLARDAPVVALTDGDLAVAVDAGSIDDVVRSLGRGGVVPVLRGG